MTEKELLNKAINGMSAAVDQTNKAHALIERYQKLLEESEQRESELIKMVKGQQTMIKNLLSNKYGDDVYGH